MNSPLPQKTIELRKPRAKLAPLPPGACHRFHAIVKPVGAQCNLDCAYCYYLHKEEMLGQARQPRMADEMLEEHIRQYIEAQTGDEVVFSWQGGEPTILGVDFFRKVVALQERHRKPGQRIENDLQTNGTLLDAEWATFLKQHDFLVGLSCDGPQDLHDRYRLTKGGATTHAKVVAAARLLQQHDVPFSVLCVVNRDNAQQPLEVYRFLTRELGARRLQFISCVEPKSFASVAPQHQSPAAQPLVGSRAARPGTPDSVVTDWSVAPEDWGHFLSAVWDDWYANDYGKVHIDLFENVVAQSLGMPAQRCITAEFCGKSLAIEHSGEVFSCDHYVYPEYRLGNIADTHWSEMAYTERQQGFGFAKRDTLPRDCRECPHLKLCWGECPKNRLVRTSSGEPGLNYLCPGLKHFYSHIQRDMPRILQQVSRYLERIQR
ncbi:anaerobic sulfatase maturase [Uliginosibacterium aquaticum]|uniref:Anaerobic sulfatase maturase n=1 Tax=Uliginosibacterium aquaticum TaxID=2731212 RepID=A0ABX2IJP4_9RHOO|nr:anaerobic sulfatase maturase [Uliginosibacterium aquaticum]NSL55212.1 anaerobic sulfatase maturase [Uliginosibacterium aquaticum]